jgi:hypothetical protein
VTPINFMNLGVNNYFVTLQSARGGTASTGSINITFDSTGLSGTYTSSLDVFFDIRVGSLTGTIVYSGDQTLISDPPSWSNLPPASGLLAINGVNQNLAGGNSEDFWPDATPTAPISETALLASHGITDTPILLSIPEPSSLLMLGMGTIGLGLYGWRRRGRAA